LEGVLEDLTYALRQQKNAAEVHGETILGSLQDGRKIQGGGEGSEGGLVSKKSRKSHRSRDGEQTQKKEGLTADAHFIGLCGCQQLFFGRVSPH
jgi:hypothetical protein